MTVIGPETIVDGRYRVRERIGAGGMADVFLADDLQLGRSVALKVLHGRFAEDREFVERFRREASSAAGLSHPNIVGVYDRGEVDGTSYIAMEHVHGPTLKQLAAERAPMEPAAAIDLVVQVLRAARFAHRRGIVHRDLKPHNVMVDDATHPPVAKVTDFGIARAGASDMTQTGSIMGTAQYLSPEQAQGLPVDARSDLYSIGIILYELLTGRVPFDGESAVTIALKQVNEQAVPPSAFNRAVTPELDAAVLRALQKDPALRPRDADEFIATLEAMVAGPGNGVPAGVPTGELPVVSPYDGFSYAPAERGRRSGWVWYALLLALVAALVVAGLLVFGGGREAEVPDVVGAEQTVAESRLRREGFEPVAVDRRSERPEGTVIATDPAPGSRVDEGSEVRLIVSAGPGTVNVPAVEGLPRSEARSRIEDAGLEIEDERREPSDDVRENRVIEVIPGEGSQVDRGSAVVLVISSGAERVAVPGVVGRSQADARAALEAAGLQVRTEEQESDSADPGTVTAQDPQGGTRVRKGTTVRLTIATEPETAEQVAVPDVAGEPQEDAIATLSGAGFQVDVQERELETPEGEGVVLEQSPQGGTAERGTTVRIVVGRYEAPTREEDPEDQTPTAPQPQATAP